MRDEKLTMRKYNCCYLTESGDSVEESKEKVVALNPETAAALYSQRYSEEYPSILVEWSSGESEVVVNTLGKERAAARLESEREKLSAILQQRAGELEDQQLRIEPLKKLHSSLHAVEGNLAQLSYTELDALVENLKDFPSMRDKISTEECAVREELYKVAFFDRNLQAALQTEQAGLQTEQAELQVELLRDLKSAFSGLQSGKSGSGAGKSNLARNAAMLGGVAALQKLNQIEENTGDVSEGLGFD